MGSKLAIGMSYTQIMNEFRLWGDGQGQGFYQQKTPQQQDCCDRVDGG